MMPSGGAEVCRDNGRLRAEVKRLTGERDEAIKDRDSANAERLDAVRVRELFSAKLDESMRDGVRLHTELGQAQERVKGLWEAINIAMEETDNSGDAPRIAKAIERRIREVELLARAREEPSR
jgi:hypothetical protein